MHEGFVLGGRIHVGDLRSETAFRLDVSIGETAMEAR